MTALLIVIRQVLRKWNEIKIKWNIFDKLYKKNLNENAQ